MDLNNLTPETLNEYYEKCSAEDKELLHKLFFDKETKDEIKQKLKNIIFEHIPPTPEEFLNPDFGFLPSSYTNSFYPHVKEDFVLAMNTKNPYQVISLYGSTRSGKSVMARLFIIYSLIYVNYMRDPHLYYKLSPMSKLSIFLVSFKQEKTREVYLAPILDIISHSNKFRVCHFERYVYERGVTEDGIIHYSEASKFGSITTPSISIVTGTDPGSFVGSDVVAGCVSELTFFKEYAHITDEQALQVFTKLNSRILNTVGRESFPCFSYIDSSANDSGSPLEKMILTEFKDNPKVFFRHYTLWKIKPFMFPKYHKTGETFTICTGDSLHPARIIKNEQELNQIPLHLQLQVPIDAYDEFDRDLLNQIKDTAGFPTNNEAKFIPDENFINKIFDNETLINVESSIKIDSMEEPKDLIWNVIKNQFFTQDSLGEFRIKRAPNEGRFIAVDIAHAIKGDIYGFSMMHLEYSKEKKKIINVFDFCFGFASGEHGINLTAVEQFIIDLSYKGKIPIVQVGSDSFQNKQTEQNLNRFKIPCLQISVDKILDPYLYFITQLYNESIKAGKNIYLKNNLNSLYRTKRKSGSEKIEHSLGSTNNIYNGDFNRSTVGINAKDVADVVCSAVYLAYLSNYSPTACYETENAKFSSDPVDQNLLIQQAYKSLHKFC